MRKESTWGLIDHGFEERDGIEKKRCSVLDQNFSLLWLYNRCYLTCDGGLLVSPAGRYHTMLEKMRTELVIFESRWYSSDIEVALLKASCGLRRRGSVGVTVFKLQRNLPCFVAGCPHPPPPQIRSLFKWWFWAWRDIFEVSFQPVFLGRNFGNSRSALEAFHTQT